MMVDLICKNNSNELCDTGKNQISIQGFLILGSTSRKTEIVLDVIDISFNNNPCFIGFVPFFGTTNGRRVGT